MVLMVMIKCFQMSIVMQIDSLRTGIETVLVSEFVIGNGIGIEKVIVEEAD